MPVRPPLLRRRHGDPCLPTPSSRAFPRRERKANNWAVAAHRFAAGTFNSDQSARAITGYRNGNRQNSDTQRDTDNFLHVERCPADRLGQQQVERVVLFFARQR